MSFDSKLSAAGALLHAEDEGAAAPRLRFPEFEGAWQPTTAGQAFRSRRDRGREGLPIYSVTLDRGLVPRETLDRHMGNDAADGANLRAEPGDLVYNTMRMWQGAVGQADVECMVSPAYVVLEPRTDISSEFFSHWFQNERMLHLLGAHSHGLTRDRLRLYFDDFAQIQINLPLKTEQDKIAAFLGSVDAKLIAMRRKKSGLEAFKSGLMQRLFSQGLRFTRGDGTAFPDWVHIRLGDAFENRAEPDTNGLLVYSVTQDRGMVPRDTLDRDFGGSAETTGYRRVQAGDLVYNTMRMWQGAVGIAPEDCSVSPAYVVLAPKGGAVPEFFVRRLRENGMIQRLKAWSHGLTEDRLRLYYPDFASIRLSVPHPDEQRKIADALSALDAKISAIADQITHMETFKKGLLQKMFV